MTIIIPTSGSCVVRIKWDNIHKALEKCLAHSQCLVNVTTYFCCCWIYENPSARTALLIEPLSFTKTHVLAINTQILLRSYWHAHFSLLKTSCLTSPHFSSTSCLDWWLCSSDFLVHDLEWPSWDMALYITGKRHCTSTLALTRKKWWWRTLVLFPMRGLSSIPQFFIESWNKTVLSPCVQRNNMAYPEEDTQPSQWERELGLFFSTAPSGLSTLLSPQVSFCLTADSIWVVALSGADPLDSYT